VRGPHPEQGIVMVMRCCPKCELTWRHPVTTCIRCHGPLTESEPDQVRVRYVTRVEIPSLRHQEVPYYCVFAEDDQGTHYLFKSRQACNPGDSVSRQATARVVSSVRLGVIGTGTMGAGLVQVALEAGWSVVWRSRSPEALERGMARVRERLLKGMRPEEVDRACASLHPTTDLAPLRESELIVESIVEDLEAKKQLLGSLGGMCGPDTILASNTSSLSVDALARGVPGPERVVGMHFFNPVPRMRLVEVVKGSATSEATVARVCDLAAQLGKVPIVVKDSPGFIVNRVLMPYLNEAARLLEEGMASAEDIDAAVQLGLAHPIGPLALIDLIGIDVFVNIMNTLVASSGESRFEVAGIAKSLVAQGRLGRKTGGGFH